ncbi:MAG TPA: DapH/DapD/GlmU-related protein [Puia sp.]|jgi:acetyltransferase-like isoleucine patch superfamily enzyme|nr:DapH/DapD/GlmU-related protein [Puia sp.]
MIARIIRKIRSILNRAINLYRLKRSGVIFGRWIIQGRIHIVNNGGRLTIGNNFTANAGKRENPIGGDTVLNLIVHTKEASLTIGENVGISNSTIVCWQEINIGNNVVIGGGCKIWDTNFHSLHPAIRTGGKDNDIRTSPIHIKDNVFIGGGVIILKGVTIGENAVIAAGSVVTRDIPANALAGGNPCRVIKTLNFT